MANIIPFRGIRPCGSKAHLIPSKPVDSYTKVELQTTLEENPDSFLHIIHPDFKDGQPTEPGSLDRLLKISKRYKNFIQEGLLVQDQQPSYYIYKQINGSNSYTGIIACIHTDDYYNGVIKIHEQTLTDREEKLKSYLDICNFNAEPVLFSYPNHRSIDNLTATIVASSPTIAFTSTDGVFHQLWVMEDHTVVSELKQHFASLKCVYIADGHHRSASSALLGKQRSKLDPHFTNGKNYNYYLGIFFPETQLKIFDFNRVVKDLNGLSDEVFLNILALQFHVTCYHQVLYKPSHLHDFCMYLNGNWYKLTPKEGIVNDANPTGSLDATILSQFILGPILGIVDLKTDRRVGFSSGIKGLEDIQLRVDNGSAKAGFGLFPVGMDQLKAIADTGNIMPPKTTWIEPKMRNGLVIYDLN